MKCDRCGSHSDEDDSHSTGWLEIRTQGRVTAWDGQEKDLCDQCALDFDAFMRERRK